MQASELFDLGCKAYNGDVQARTEWFKKMAPLAQRAAKPYGVLPGIILARAALESGWGSDLYEKVMEQKFGVRFAGKAQNHNNLVGMVAYGKNDEYPSKFPAPAWAEYKWIFEDYGPHGDMSGNYTLAREKWKDYRAIGDCFGDFAAVLRAQAERRKESWPSDTRGQLLSIGRGYTPEGAPSEMGLDFTWQDKTLALYTEFELWKIDGRSEMDKAPMTDLPRYIKAAYEYTHRYCAYGPSGTTYPPGAAPARLNDCVGLVFLAFWFMGRYPQPVTIDQVVDLCLANGMKKSDDINDVWKRKGVVCFQHENNVDTPHVNHVFYTLGGTSMTDISKYDLGSKERIRAAQPFEHVAVHEWPGKMEFMCMLYLPEGEKLPDVPHFEVESETLGVVAKRAGLYAGPGTAFRKLGRVTEGDDIIIRGYVTNGAGNLWRAVRYKGEQGFVGSAAAKPKMFTAYNAIVKGTDGTLALRAGAGGGCYKVGDIKEGKAVRVDGKAKSEDGTEWLHVKASIDGKPMRGFAAAKYVIKA